MRAAGAWGLNAPTAIPSLSNGVKRPVNGEKHR